MDTYCVWSRVPSPGRSMECWSRVTGGLRLGEAQWYAAVSFFESTVMADDADLRPNEPADRRGPAAAP